MSLFLHKADTRDERRDLSSWEYNRHGGLIALSKAKRLRGASSAGRLRQLGLLIGKQPQQYLIASLIAVRITFGDRDEFAILSDVFSMNENLHLRPPTV